MEIKELVILCMGLVNKTAVYGGFNAYRMFFVVIIFSLNVQQMSLCIGLQTIQMQPMPTIMLQR